MSLKAFNFKKKFNDEYSTDFEKQVIEALGHSVKINFDIESFDVSYANGKVLEDEGIIDGFSNNCFKPLLSAFTQAKQDPKIKSRLSNQLHEIEISNVNETDTSYGFAEFVGNSLILRSPATVNTHGPHATTITEVILSALYKGI